MLGFIIRKFLSHWWTFSCFLCRSKWEKVSISFLVFACSLPTGACLGDLSTERHSHHINKDRLLLNHRLLLLIYEPFDRKQNLDFTLATKQQLKKNTKLEVNPSSCSIELCYSTLKSAISLLL